MRGGVGPGGIRRGALHGQVPEAGRAPLHGQAHVRLGAGDQVGLPEGQLRGGRLPVHGRQEARPEDLHGHGVPRAGREGHLHVVEGRGVVGAVVVVVILARLEALRGEDDARGVPAPVVQAERDRPGVTQAHLELDDGVREAQGVPVRGGVVLLRDGLAAQRAVLDRPAALGGLPRGAQGRQGVTQEAGAGCGHQLGGRGDRGGQDAQEGQGQQGGFHTPWRPRAGGKFRVVRHPAQVRVRGWPMRARAGGS